MKTKFNFNPSGIDRSKQFPVLLMRSGIKRFIFGGKNCTGDPTPEQAPNGYLLLENKGWHMVFDVVKTEQYINLTRYYVQGGTYSYKSFKECQEKNEPVIFLKGIGDSYNCPEALKSFQQWLNIRLYSNNTIAAFVTFITPETNVARTFQFNLQKVPSYSWLVWQEACMKLLGLSRTQQEQEYFDRYYSRNESLFRAADPTSVVREIQCEEDIIPEQVNKKQAKVLYGFLVASGMDTTLLFTNEKNVTYETDKFPDDWKQFFPTFKGDRYCAALKMASEDFNDHRFGYQANKKLEPFYPSLAFANVGISDSYLNRSKTKKQSLDEIWDEAYDQTIVQGQSSIKRIDDKIVLSMHIDRSCAWYNNKYLFIFDTKERTRKALGRIGNEEVHQLMLTSNTISDFTYAFKQYCHRLIINDTFDVLFKGSMLSWLFNAAITDTLPNPKEAEHSYIHWSSDWNSETRRYDYDGISVLYWAKNPEIANETWGKILIEVFMKEKPIMEQLAKCGLWNIFSNCLQNSDWIVKQDSAAARDGSGCMMIGKGKALTTSLGLTMNQLRMIDAEVGTGSELLEPGQSSECPCRNINLISAMQVLEIGLKDLKALDNKTFETIIRLSLSTRDRYYGSRNSIFGSLNGRWNAEYIRKAVRSIDSVSRKIAFISKFFNPDNTNSVETFNDYMRMRGELKRTLENLEEHDELKSFETNWPLWPEACTVFFRYAPGTRVTASQWDPDGGQFVHTVSEFKNYLLNHYKEESIKFIYDNTSPMVNQLVGAVLKLSACDHVQYLHDELSIWMANKKSENIRKGFKKAADQMKKMEYISEKYGLRIVAPTEPSDLQREGRVLHHCVGGYVDSVAQGVEKILFIRRNDMPSEPYFTMDVTSDGTIRQIHSYSNLHPTPESIKEAYRVSGQRVYAESKDILGFLEEWAKKTAGVKASSISKHYGCLGAMAH